MPLGIADKTKIHQGPGWLYLNVAAPASGSRHLISADGTPTQPARANSTPVTAGQMIVDSNGNVQECTTAGTTGATPPTFGTTVGSTTADGTATWTLVALGPAYVFAGGVDGATTYTMGAKIEEVSVDQETLPIDAVQTGEAEELDVKLKESDMGKLRSLLPHGTYASGTDTGLPAGSQAYEEIAFGGLIAVPRYGVLVISPRKDSTTKYVISQLYKAYQAEAVKLDIQRGKEVIYGVKFKSLAAQVRPIGDRGGKIFRQT